MEKLLKEIKACKVCLPFLVNGVNPVLAVHQKSRIVIIGQAPGNIVHKTGIPWNDKSGDRLRLWLNVSSDQFYNTELFALLPIGFCYPGRGKTGDLPPRKECAPLWHKKVLDKIDNIQLIILVGSYAQSYYLGLNMKKNLTESVKKYKDYLPKYFPLPHPSPRNNIWLKKNPWFEQNLIPDLQKTISNIL